MQPQSSQVNPCAVTGAGLGFRRALLPLLIAGPGRVSIDHLIRRHYSRDS